MYINFPKRKHNHYDFHYLMVQYYSRGDATLCNIQHSMCTKVPDKSKLSTSVNQLVLSDVHY